jgi:4-amino-4-deoxy-L-arabinose transferase-like glycosyltransferase
MALSRRTRNGIGLVLVVLLAAMLRYYRLDSLPPGLWFDEAWVSLQARDLLSQPVWPVYFAAGFGGIHPAIVYWTALFRWLSGQHPLAIRYAVATAGIISVAFTYFSLQAILWTDDSTEDNVPTALAGALILAITFPFLLLTRIGFETILPAIPASLIFFFLARTVHTRWPATDYVWAGMVLGLSLYTYYSARFLPVAVTVAIIWLAWIRRDYRRSLAGLGVTALFALLVFLPLGVYFLQHWEQFTGRAGVSSYNTLGPGAASVPLALLSNLYDTLAGFSLPGFGDALARHNLPGRPVFDPFLSLLFWGGVFTLARRPRQPRTALLFSWAGGMLLPVILTDGAPTFTRMLAAMPALAGIAAVGGRALYRALATWTAARAPWLAPAVLLAGLGVSLGVTVYDYFGRWAQDPRLYDAFEVGDWQAAVLVQERLADGPVYLVPDLLTPARPTFDQLLGGSGVKPVAAAGCLATFDRPARPVTYVFDARQAGGLLSRLEAAFPGQGTVETIIHPASGETLFAAFTVPAGATADLPAQAATATFGPVALTGYAIEPAQPRPGETLTVRLFWQAQTNLVADYTVFVHLYAPGAEDNAPAAQSDQMPCAGAYPTSRWDSGEIIVDEHTLLVPADFAADSAVAAVGIYSWPSLERLPLETSIAALPGDRLILTAVPVGGE